MRVLLVSLEYPPHIWGGLGIYLMNLVRELSPRIHVSILTMEGETPLGAGFELPNVETVRLRSRMRRWPFRHLEFLARANRYVAEHGRRFDLVNDHSRLIRRCECPLVVTVHSTEQQELGAVTSATRRPSLKERIVRTGLLALSRWERRNILAADRLLTISRPMARYLGQRFGRSDVDLAPPGVDPAFFTPGPEERSNDILFVGRFNSRKGIGDLREALDRLPSLSVVLCGTGESREELRDLRAWCESTRHRVRLRLDLPHVDMPGLYRESRLLVVPSLYEPFGMVALEAMACGTPVIATRVGGLRLLVRDGREGIVVPPGDPGALAGAIRRLIEDDGERRRMSASARARSRCYPWQTTAEGSLRAYSRSLRPSRLEVRP